MMKLDTAKDIKRSFSVKYLGKKGVHYVGLMQESKTFFLRVAGSSEEGLAALPDEWEGLKVAKEFQEEMAEAYAESRI